MGNASSRGFAQGRPTCAPPAQPLEVRTNGDGDPLKQYPPSPRGYGATGVTAVVDGTDGDVVERYAYDPYGRVTVLNGENDGGVSDWSADADNASDWDNRILYCGYFRDAETGLDHVRNRYRHTTLGWITRDPLGYLDGPNRYAYARCRPLVFVDPDGRVVLYAEGAVSKFRDMKDKSDELSQTLKRWAKKHGQERHHYRHRRAWWDPVGLFTGQYFNQRQINNNAENMFEKMKEACKEGDPIYIYAHSTGAVTAARAIKKLAKYNEDEGCDECCRVDSVTIYAGSLSVEGFNATLPAFARTTDRLTRLAGGADAIIDGTELLWNADLRGGKNIGQDETFPEAPTTSLLSNNRGLTLGPQTEYRQEVIRGKDHGCGVSQWMAKRVMRAWERLEAAR